VNGKVPYLFALNANATSSTIGAKRKT
jgi:hypothetical protein